MGISSETAALFKTALNSKGLSPDELLKVVSTGSGLVAYDLQAPAKNLYPTITPLRNSIPRVNGKGGTATNWRVVQSIVGSGFDAMGWVPEGQRSGQMSYVTANQAASYVTIGEEDALTFEAESAAEGFEDLNSTVTMRLLQKMMRKEEMGILGGNASLALGTPTAPTLSAATLAGATLPALTYSVIVVALTFEGWKNSSLANGVATTKTITGADGKTFVLNGGSSNKSTNTTQAITLGQKLTATVPYVPGAVAYAWFVGAAAAETLQAITTVNTAVFSVPLTGGAQAIAAITADNSRNANYAFDGLLNIGMNPANSAYVNTFAAGSTLTASGRGSVVEIDTMLQSMWDNFRLSADVLYMNSQQIKDVTTKVLTGASSAPLLRFNNDGDAQYELTASGVITAYYNPFSVDGGTKIPVKIHPDVPPGLILGWCEHLPPAYQSNEVPNVAEVHTRRDYYRMDWPLRTRQREMGVYAEEVLACYFPQAIGIVNNITPG
jgi:hypothetical protein